MKTKRPETLAVVIGRNRRVYARVYKLTRYIDAFALRYYGKEIEKSYDEGFRPCGLRLEKPNETTWVFRVEYEPA